MLNRIIFFIFLFSLPFGKGRGWASAQDSLIVQKKSKQSIEFVGDVFLNSNTITNDFIRVFYKGQFIDDVLKENATDKILSSNRLGGASRVGFTYSRAPLSGGEGKVRKDSRRSPADSFGGVRRFSFSFFDRQHLDMKFSDDLFNMIFYGNKIFADDTAMLGNFRFNLLRYQQFRVGWDWKGDAAHGSYGFAFSLLSGEQNFSVKADRADLFTADFNTYNDIVIAMDVQQTDTSQRKYFAQNGMGLSTDFYYELPYIVWKKSGRITFEVKDLGLIRWNSNSIQYSVDSSYHYDGYFIPLENVWNGIPAQFTADSIIGKNIHIEKKQYTANLPFTLDIHTKSYYGKQLAFEKGIIFWFNTSAKPHYFGKLHFIAGRKKNIDLSYVLGYGGYGRFNSGLEAKIDFAKHYSLHMIDNYLFSGIAQTSYGMGLYLKFVRRF